MDREHEWRESERFVGGAQKRHAATQRGSTSPTKLLGRR